MALYPIELKSILDASEARLALKRHFDFDLPDSVVSSTMRKLAKAGDLKSDNGKFTIVRQPKEAESFHKRIEEKEQARRIIEDALVRFVESEIAAKISNAERVELIESLIRFVMGGKSSGKFGQQINSFIIKNAHKSSITGQLNYFREGAVILAGLRHTNDLAEISNWNDELVLLLDMEILFHAAGYNGILFQQLFNDFLDQVRSINQVSQKKQLKNLIRLKYLRSVEEAVKGYFGVAMEIVSNRRSYSPEKEAMRNICNGCKTAVDVVRRRAEFEQLLKKLDIQVLEDLDYYERYEFVIDDNQLFEQLKGKYGAEEVEEAFVAFTKVSAFRRGNSNRKLEKCGYLIISGKYSLNGISFELSKDPNENYTPFCTDLEHITNRLWFKTNVGLSNSGTIPHSMDVLAKAQIAISSQLSSAVATKYKELRMELEDGSLDEEVAAKMLLELRSNYKKPEEITRENVDSSIEFLNEDSLEKHRRELTLLKEKADRGAKAEEKLRMREEQEERKRIVGIDRNVAIRTISITILLGISAAGIVLLSIWGICKLVRPGDTPLSILGLILTIIVEASAFIWLGKKLATWVKGLAESYRKKLLARGREDLTRS